MAEEDEFDADFLMALKASVKSKASFKNLYLLK